MLNFRQRLLSTTLMAGVAAIAAPVYAQDASTAATPQADASPTDAQASPNGPVEAQPAPSTNAQGAPTDARKDIVVTGTRIPQPNLTSAAPVTVVTNQDVKLTGTTRVEDLLNQLPSVGAAQTSGVSNGASGTAEVDLRYLGPKRTLALVNGRRLTPGDPATTNQSADLNLIPSALIKRVEVLTGGASSVYGADAVAGVVNFIMDTNFTGIRFDGQASFYQHNNKNFGLGLNCAAPQASAGCAAAGDPQTINSILAGRGYLGAKGNSVNGGTFDGTVSMGTAFADGRGHAVAYLGYRKVDAVLQSSRNYSECVIQDSANLRCGGSQTAGPLGNFYDSVSQGYRINPDGSVTAAAGAALNLYNFAPLNYYQRPDERYSAGVFADYEVTPAVKPYLEFMFMDNHTLAQIAPSGDFGDTLTMNCDNPFLTPSAAAAICAPGNLVNGYLGNYPQTPDAPAGGNPAAPPIDFDNGFGGTFNRGYMQLLRRNVEGGPRIYDVTHTSYRGVLGTKGDLSKVFSYDAYYQYGRTDYSAANKSYFSIARLRRALDVVDDPRTPGVVDPICRSVLDGTDLACVPYNPFGTPTAAAVKYLSVDALFTGQTSEQVADVNVTGALGEAGVQTPWSDEGVGINAGVEYRKESLTLNPDQEAQTGDLAGAGGPVPPVSGNFRVLEAFAEAQIPIIRHSFIEELSFGAGYRRSAYKLSTGRTYDTDTYKLSAELAPVRDIRFRGSYNRAVRAPNIAELFTPGVVGLDGSTDPCAGITIAATDYGCIAQGLTVGQNTPANPAEQYNGLLGGNPDLKPEKATTKTVGVVIQPRWIPRLALTIDYWNIDLKGAVQGFGADAILADCVAKATATFTPASCGLIHRDPGGSLWLTPNGWVNDLPTNVGGIKTNGFDVNTSYSQRLGRVGNLSLTFLGTYLRKYVTDNGISEPYDCAGYYGSLCSGGTVSSGAPMPKWKHKLRATLQMPFGLGLSAQWRHVGRVKNERLSDNPSLNGTPPLLGATIAAQDYFDLASTFNLGDHYNFRLGVNNLLDRKPPLVSSSGGACPSGPCNGNTYPGSYDALGRYLYAGVTVNF